MSQAERQPLSRERILAKAIELADDHGLESLSMRKLGVALGVEAMSLYNHVSNKDDLLDGMLDQVMQEIPIPDLALPWPERVRQLLRSTRAMGLRHPGVAPLLGGRPTLSVQGFRPVVALYETLREGGFDPDRAIHAFVFAGTFAIGVLHVDHSLAHELIEPARGAQESWMGIDDPTTVDLGVKLGAVEWQDEYDQLLDLVVESLVLLSGSDRPNPA